MQTTSTMLDLEEGQAYDFAMASYDAHGEESELPSEVIFNGASENSAGERGVKLTVRRPMKLIGSMQTPSQLTTL